MPELALLSPVRFAFQIDGTFPGMDCFGAIALCDTEPGNIFPNPNQTLEPGKIETKTFGPVVQRFGGKQYKHDAFLLLVSAGAFSISALPVFRSYLGIFP